MLSLWNFDAPLLFYFNLRINMNDSRINMNDSRIDMNDSQIDINDMQIKKIIIFLFIIHIFLYF